MKTYSTVEVADRCRAACGKRVGNQFVRESYLAMYGLDHLGSGHRWQLTERQADLIIMYAMAWHGSPNAPGIVAWAKEHGHEIPTLRKTLLPAVARRQQGKESEGPAEILQAIAFQREEIGELKLRIARLEEKREQPKARAERKKLPGQVISITKRRVKAMIVSWARDRDDIYDTAYSEVYRAWWKDREQPSDWFQCQSDGEGKLDYFEKNDLLGELLKELPYFLAEMSKRHLIRGQKELP